MKPLKENATDEEKAAREAKLAETKPKVGEGGAGDEPWLVTECVQASRILVLVRHGQYNLEGTQDSERWG